MIYDLDLSKGASSIAIDSKNSFLEKTLSQTIDWHQNGSCCPQIIHRCFSNFPNHRFRAPSSQPRRPNSHTISLSLLPTSPASERSIKPYCELQIVTKETSTFSSNLTTVQLATQHEIDMAYIIFMMTVVSIISILGFNILKSGNVYGRTCNCSATELVGRRVTR